MAQLRLSSLRLIALGQTKAGIGSNDRASPTTGYCKGAVHSVAADFNGGALECDCDGEGTQAGQTESCAKMGGQCACKPNVIGRQCTKCKPDFFGFPDCKQVELT